MTGCAYRPSTTWRRARRCSVRSPHRLGPGDVAINDDGSLVAVAGGYDGDVVVYRTADGEQAACRRPTRPRGRPADRDRRPSGSGPTGSFYVGSLAGPIRVVDPATPTWSATIDTPPFASNRRLVVAGDLVVAAGDEALVARRVSDGSVRWTIEIRGTHPGTVPVLHRSGGHRAVVLRRLLRRDRRTRPETGERTG